MRPRLLAAIVAENERQQRAKRLGLKRQSSCAGMSFLTWCLLAILACFACLLLAFILSGPPI
jgi:hypothetical protein